MVSGANNEIGVATSLSVFQEIYSRFIWRFRDYVVNEYQILCCKKKYKTNLFVEGYSNYDQMQLYVTNTWMGQEQSWLEENRLRS